ncbi:MAG: helix-turn-helix domain-containing protein [Treponemataceae bacterium]|nr:helix-turn-helix domain-containing protein [Treponemataceae bacterium]
MIKTVEEVPLILRIEDVVELLNVSKSTVSDWSKSGRLPAHYVGSVPFYQKEELLEFLGYKPNKEAAVISWLKDQLEKLSAQQQKEMQEII